MKKFLSVLLAATVLAAPLAQAQSRHDDRPGHRMERSVTTKKVIIKKHRWDRGQRLSASERRHMVDRRDYRRYNLREPRRGERWVRVDNQYLLINAVNGLIIGLSSSR
ncbi:Ni/Co efflux regulator RcnB [Rhizobium skierniewicense]|uniref:Ni/Co efflux regulator RcnB n=1 Tax=Rhizobium skierniewicense TaxID=984260 RepID=A0A7W6CE57_9HYPH|nr:RcnB family protein [Rhizobium skierniewicense]MBB3947804.1 Ni/Co efflux regulator RcnB [Rhizobium skierniewicense]NTF31731.1 RcnB family protein [Rhizobium skierniewicense]